MPLTFAIRPRKTILSLLNSVEWISYRYENPNSVRYDLDLAIR